MGKKDGSTFLFGDVGEGGKGGGGNLLLLSTTWQEGGKGDASAVVSRREKGKKGGTAESWPIRLPQGQRKRERKNVRAFPALVCTGGRGEEGVGLDHHFRQKEKKKGGILRRRRTGGKKGRREEDRRPGVFHLLEEKED